jgi:hypothetical protein
VRAEIASVPPTLELQPELAELVARVLPQPRLAGPDVLLRALPRRVQRLLIDRLVRGPLRRGLQRRAAIQLRHGDLLILPVRELLIGPLQQLRLPRIVLLAARPLRP